MEEGEEEDSKSGLSLCSLHSSSKEKDLGQTVFTGDFPRVKRERERDQEIKAKENVFYYEVGRTSSWFLLSSLYQRKKED